MTISYHFEVVDANDRIVGDVKHATAKQACDLRRSLLDGGYNGRLGVAEVTQRVVVQRDVRRLALSEAVA